MNVFHLIALGACYGPTRIIMGWFMRELLMMVVVPGCYGIGTTGFGSASGSGSGYVLATQKCN